MSYLRLLWFLIFSATAQASFATEEIVPRVLLRGCADVALMDEQKKVLALDGAGRLTEWSLDSGEYLRDLSSIGTVSKFAYLSDGRLVIQRHNGKLEVYSLGNEKSVTTIADALEYRDFSVARTAPILSALTVDKSALGVFKLSGSRSQSKPLILRAPSGYDLVGFSVSASGDAIGFVDEIGGAYIANASDGAIRELPKNIKAVGITVLSANRVFVWEDISYLPRSVEYWYENGKWVTNDENYFGIPVDTRTENSPLLFIARAGLGFASLHEGGQRSGRAGKRAELWTLPISPGLREVRWHESSGTIVTCAENLARWRPKQNELLWSQVAQGVNGVTVDYITGNGIFASIADWDGRTAIWNIRARQYEREFPPLKRLVLPTLGGLSEDGRIYAYFGHSNILTLFRASNDSISVDNLPTAEISSEPWENRVLYSQAGKIFLLKSKTQLKKVAIEGLRQRPEPMGIEDAKTKKEIIDAKGTGCGEFYGRDAMTVSGRYAAFGCVNGGVLAIDIREGTHKFFKIDELHDNRQQKSWVSAIKFIGDDQIIVAIRRDMLYRSDQLSRVPSSGASTIFRIDREKSKLERLPIQVSEPITDLAVDSKRNRIFVASFFGSVSEFDIASGRSERRIEGVAYPIIGMNYDDLEDKLIVFGDDGILREISSGMARSRINTIFLPAGHFVTRVPSGQVFLSYPGVKESLRLDNGSFLVLKGRPFVEGDSADGVQSWHPSIASSSLSEIRNMSVAEDKSGTVMTLEIDEKKTANNESILVFINDRLAGITKSERMIKFLLPNLSDGDDISAVVYSSIAGYGPMARTTFANEDLGGRVVGAFVGVNNYSSQRLKTLLYAEKDAKTLADAFGEAVPPNKAEMHVFPVGEKPTAKEILRFVRETMERTKPEDTFILFLSGHGGMGKFQFYFAATDAREVDSSQEEYEGVISGEQIVNLIKEVRAKNVLVLLDACEGGRLNSDWFKLYSKMAISPFFGMKMMSSAKSVFMAAAAPEYQHAREGWNSGGLFAATVSEALLSKELRSEEQLSASALLYYLSDKVPSRARKIYGEDIRPILSFGTRDFPVKQTRDHERQKSN